MPIVYKINVLAELKARGYNTTRLRQEKIMGERVIQQLRKNEIASWGTIEKLCALLNCQPGDIVEFVPDAAAWDGGENMG